LSSKLGLMPHSPALQRLFDDNVLVEEVTSVRLPSYQLKLTQQQQEKIDAFLRALSQNPYSPPGDITLEPDLLNLLVEQQRVVKVSGGVVFSASAYKEMVDKVVAYAKVKGRVTLGEVRDMLGTSRKYAQVLLEHMDEKKLTRRVGDERVLR
jgi:selenocysteine-specific elongation factor